MDALASGAPVEGFVEDDSADGQMTPEEERRSGLFRACCAQLWRWVLLTSQAMAGCDLTGQLTVWGPARDLVVPDGWADGTSGADGPRAVMAEVAPRAMPERRSLVTPAELARLHVLRAQMDASRVPFTTPELARLRFVRWLHQTERVTP